jgi:hypothetical protein
MVPDDIKDILKNADQSVDFILTLGSTLPEMLLSDKPAIDFIEKGA